MRAAAAGDSNGGLGVAAAGDSNGGLGVAAAGESPLTTQPTAGGADAGYPAIKAVLPDAHVAKLANQLGAANALRIAGHAMGVDWHARLTEAVRAPTTSSCWADTGVTCALSSAAISLPDQLQQAVRGLGLVCDVCGAPFDGKDAPTRCVTPREALGAMPQLTVCVRVQALQWRLSVSRTRRFRSRWSW